ncbi:MAG: tRNA 2-thiouridine(34) synthase MnmA [Desulfosalsimonadaceae bacterium]
MPRNGKNTTAVALSGGIDSLVSAFLLKQQGVDIFGVHFITGYESAAGQTDPQPRIDHLSRMLGIPVHAIDIRETFENRVVNYFVKTYMSGKTPNPCVCCNREIKFGIMLDYARSLGAVRLATGHYARTEKTQAGRWTLKKGLDPGKDQSYFLGMLDSSQLAQTCFPLGEKSKNEVRHIAQQNNLQPFAAKESQDICFIKGISCQDFLEARLHRRFDSGDIVDANGKGIGRHQGLFRYTIGQRRGINCPGPHPYYVLDIDVRQNRLVVGFKEELYKNGCSVAGVNWIFPRPAGPVNVSARIRYRHKAAPSVLTPSGGHFAKLEFIRPQAAVTPGQAAVCYQGDAVVAAGWIE